MFKNVSLSDNHGACPLHWRVSSVKKLPATAALNAAHPELGECCICAKRVAAGHHAFHSGVRTRRAFKT